MTEYNEEAKVIMLTPSEFNMGLSAVEAIQEVYNKEEDVEKKAESIREKTAKLEDFAVRKAAKIHGITEEKARAMFDFTKKMRRKHPQMSNLRLQRKVFAEFHIKPVKP